MIERICAHRVNFEYLDEDPGTELKEVPESEIEHVQEMIIEGNVQGELCFIDNDKEIEHRGWWIIIK